MTKSLMTCLQAVGIICGVTLTAGQVRGQGGPADAGLPADGPSAKTDVAVAVAVAVADALGVIGDARPVDAIPVSAPVPDEPEPADLVTAVGVKPPKGNRGAVVGTVADGKTGEGLIEAQVSVVGAKKKVLTDLDGKYRLELAPGTYELRIWAELKAARRVSGVEVEKGKVVRLDMVLEDDQKATLKEIVIVAPVDKTTEAVQVVRRQKSVTVSDAVSAEQISRSPDSSASDAVKRVVGATIQDGKYVIIRGLGGRYSLTLLNGVALPSPDPDLPAAPLDLFPAAMLSNLTIAKAFTPDMPGNFAGGALMIESRDFPTKFTLKLRLGTSADTQATFRNVNTYQGGRLDFLGYDDGGRKLPSSVPAGRRLDGDATDAEREAAGEAFSNRWNRLSHRALPNLSLGATVGDTLSLKGKQFGYLATVNYGNAWTRQLSHIARAGQPDPVTGKAQPLDETLTADVGAQKASLGGLLNLGFTPSSAHRMGLLALYTHTTEDSASFTTGLESNRNDVRRLRMRFLERQMQFTQLSGEDSLVGGRAIVGWQGHLAFTAQNEPDSRDLLRVRPDGEMVYAVGGGVGGADRVFGKVEDVSGGGSADLTLPFRALRLKVGGAVQASKRDASIRRFSYDVGSDVAGLPSDEIFTAENIGGAVRFRETTKSEDGFAAGRQVFAGYLMADLLALDPFRVIAGARYEVANLDLHLGRGVGAAEAMRKDTSRKDKGLLPAVNLVYAAGQKTNLRAAYSSTVARPHLRELSREPFFDYVRRRVTSGNPDLKQTRIQNADLRWEMFLGGSELLAASLFYKRFENPIERTVTSAGSGDNVGYTNAESANSLGLELEARLTGGLLSPRMAPYYLGTNLSLIRSRVKVTGKERAMQGQSPYVANAELGYRKGKSQVSALYNVFGARISEVGIAPAGDVYERAFHRVDAAFVQGLGGGFSLKLSATNLLNQQVVIEQNGVAIFAYKPGVTMLASVEWSFDKGKEE